MRSWLVVALSVAGCRQVLGIEPPSTAASGVDASGTDASGADAAASDGPHQFCYGAAGYQLCFATPPTGDVVLTGSNNKISTNTFTACTAAPTSWGSAQPDVCMIAADTIELTTSLRVTGTKPLVLVAATSIDIAATLDLSNNGAGSAQPQCATINGYSDTSTSNTGGGGAGGSLKTQGGAGGYGSGYGVPCPAETNHVPLRGGMAGGGGGDYEANNGGGTGGLGGGAVFLAAGSAITVDGVINVSGGGGAGGTYYGGGGAGGAGGMVALAAPLLSVGGIIMANGGGGGTPGINDAATGYGASPSVSSPLDGGSGGTMDQGSGSQPSGGHGCGAAAPAVAGASGTAGGGGGCGFVLVSGTVTGGTSISPGTNPF